MAAMRLAGDLLADRFAEDHRPTVRRFDTAIAAPGREIAVRIHDPAPDPGASGLRPAICYFHGGGFALGSIESFDIATAALAETSGAVVASVHYRRLPETAYAGAQADCDEGFAWLVHNAASLDIDPARILLGGDSAGALLALACAANARDTDVAVPAGLLLFYGTFAMDAGRPAYRTARDPLLSQQRIESYVALLVGSGGLAAGPAPIDRDDLAGLPPTHIVAAEHDPLCSEAGELAVRLAAAGVDAHRSMIAPGMIHGFLRAAGVSAAGARRDWRRHADAVRPCLWPLDGRPHIRKVRTVKTGRKLYERGRALRLEMFGEPGVRSLDAADDFQEPLQDLVTRHVLRRRVEPAGPRSRKTRSPADHRDAGRPGAAGPAAQPCERCARSNGVTKEETARIAGARVASMSGLPAGVRQPGGMPAKCLAVKPVLTDTRARAALLRDAARGDLADRGHRRGRAQRPALISWSTPRTGRMRAT
jgi:acetyl esterase